MFSIFDDFNDILLLEHVSLKIGRVKSLSGNDNYLSHSKMYLGLQVIPAPFATYLLTPFNANE